MAKLHTWIVTGRSQAIIEVESASGFRRRKPLSFWPQAGNCDLFCAGGRAGSAAVEGEIEFSRSDHFNIQLVGNGKSVHGLVMDVDVSCPVPRRRCAHGIDVCAKVAYQQSLWRGMVRRKELDGSTAHVHVVLFKDAGRSRRPRSVRCRPLGVNGVYRGGVRDVEALGRIGHHGILNERRPELQKALQHLFDGLMETVEQVSADCGSRAFAAVASDQSMVTASRADASGGLRSRIEPERVRLIVGWAERHCAGADNKLPPVRMHGRNRTRSRPAFRGGVVQFGSFREPGIVGIGLEGGVTWGLSTACDPGLGIRGLALREGARLRASAPEGEPPPGKEQRLRGTRCIRAESALALGIDSCGTAFVGAFGERLGQRPVLCVFRNAFRKAKVLATRGIVGSG